MTVRLSHIEIEVCARCLFGLGDECHVPGCIFWMRAVPSQEVASALRTVERLPRSLEVQT
jgi:hypothetical protein